MGRNKPMAPRPLEKGSESAMLRHMERYDPLALGERVGVPSYGRNVALCRCIT